jgi:hypothetical protein
MRVLAYCLMPNHGELVYVGNQPLAVRELDGLRHRVNRGTPYGSAEWTAHVANELGLAASPRPRGRQERK